MHIHENACPGTGTGVPLAFQDLSSKDFRGQKLYKADLRGTNFSKANMEGASLFGAFCKDAKFVGARLNNADLESVDFENADLSEAVLEGAQVCLAWHQLLIYLMSAPSFVAVFLLNDFCEMTMQVTNAKFKNVNIVGSDCKSTPLSPREILICFKGQLSHAEWHHSLAWSEEHPGCAGTDVVLRRDVQQQLCKIASGTNPVTGMDTRESLVCS